MTENLFRNNMASFFMSTAALSVKGTDKMKNLNKYESRGTEYKKELK